MVGYIKVGRSALGMLPKRVWLVVCGHLDAAMLITSNPLTPNNEAQSTIACPESDSVIKFS